MTTLLFARKLKYKQMYYIKQHYTSCSSGSWVLIRSYLETIIVASGGGTPEESEKRSRVCLNS